MHKIRLYIIQALGIIMLIFGYLLSDRPDNESMMHFNLQGNTVLSRAADDYDNDQEEAVIAPSENHRHHHHKLRFTKDFPPKMMVPIEPIVFQYRPLLSTVYLVSLSDSYYYLFFKEINPPPPKLS